MMVSVLLLNLLTVDIVRHINLAIEGELNMVQITTYVVTSGYAVIDANATYVWLRGYVGGYAVICFGSVADA